MPELSVLLAAHNAEKYVKTAVDSILSQSFRDIELLMADDGSSDGTRKELDNYSTDPRVKLHHNYTNKGKTKTINKLYGLSSGRFVTIHDADDFSDHSRFTIQIGILRQEPDILMVGCNFRSFVDGNRFSEESKLELEHEIIQKKILNASQFHGPTMVIRKKVIEDYLEGQFLRPFFQDYNEDCDLAIRLVDKGRCINLKEVLYHYRILPDSLSKTITPRKKCLYSMLVHFHSQRQRHGKDDLQRGNLLVASRKLNYLCQQSYSEPTQVLRERASFLMYYQLHTAAISVSLRAVCEAPLILANWGTLQYCLRKFMTVTR